MSVTINIKGTPIEFPSTGESPNWAPALIEFAQAVEEAFNSAIGPYDVPAQVFTITSEINPTPLNITGLAFPTTVVRAAFINYSIVREGTTTLKEVGKIFALYDGSDWTLTREYTGDLAVSDFDCDSAGQFFITTTALSGYTSGSISFSAKALSQT